MPSSLLSSITPYCLLLAFTKVPAALPGPMSTVYYQTFLRYVLFALWGHCCGTYFWCSLILIISLYFSYLTGDPTLKAFLGLPGLWVLEFHWAGLSQPQPVSSHYLQSLYVISWATLSYLGPFLSTQSQVPFLRMKATMSRLTHSVPVNKQPRKTLRSMTL